MKKIVILLLTMVIALGGVSAQSKGKTGKGKKKDTPAMAGKQKIRESDFRTYDRFTSFNTKDTNRYYTPFDYAKIPDIAKQRNPDWKELQPVMNYLEKVSRATLTMCFVFAVSPDIADPADRERLSAQAMAEAIKASEAFEAWKQEMGWRNKVQYKAAEIDYRYFKGANYENEPATGDVVHVGTLLYFGSKKKSIINIEQPSRTFPDVKFFPNDATIVESWETLLDEVADYLKENDRRSVLLVGYADNSGTEAYNKGLSRQRAVELKKALLRRGVEGNRIEIEALGDADPIGDNSTYEGRVQNNRVSIKIQ